MAVTGVILLGYVVGHVLGNLLIFVGREALNEYSAFLHANLALIWGTRILLLIAVAGHIGAAIRLHLLKSAARPVLYVDYKPKRSTYASRTMMWSGPIVAFFVIYHLLHLTWGVAHINYTDDVYRNLVTAFDRPLVSGVYIIAMLALGLHLSHGIWSMFQTIGANTPRWDKTLRIAAVVISVVLMAGFIAVPVAVLADFVVLE